MGLINQSGLVCRFCKKAVRNDAIRIETTSPRASITLCRNCNGALESLLDAKFSAFERMITDLYKSVYSLREELKVMRSLR